jgi:thiol-disulfide isomerase/thioredoxin
MNRRSMTIGAAALAAGAGFALYGIDGPQGNGGAQAACGPALATAERMAPLARGEVAAFQVARQPRNIGDLSFAGPDGEPMSLASFAGQVALVNLWATWCAPCREEMPALDQLQQAMGSEDFQVVTVNIDMGSVDRPIAFLESIGVEHLPLYRDASTKIFDELRSRGIAVGLPVTAMIDDEGCVLGHMNGPAEWDSDDAMRLVEAALEPAG